MERSPRDIDLGGVIAEARHRRFHWFWRLLAVLLAGAAVFATLVSRGLSQVDEREGAWGALKVAAVPLALLVLMAIALAAYHRRDRIVVRARGVEQRIGRRLVVLAFHDVVASRTWIDRSASPRSIDVRLRDGSKRTLFPPIAGPVTKALRDALDERHRARASEAFDRGRAMRCGDVDVDLVKGIARDGHVLSWSAFAEVTMTPEVVVVSERGRNGAKKDWTVVSPVSNDDVDGLVSTIRLGRERARVDSRDEYR